MGTPFKLVELHDTDHTFKIQCVPKCVGMLLLEMLHANK